MTMQYDEDFLYCDEDMPCALSPESTEDHISVEIDAMHEETLFLDSDMAVCKNEQSEHERGVQTVCDRQRVLRWMFAQSTGIEFHRKPLLPSVVTLRMACVRKMQQILHFSQMNGETVVREDTVIQAIMLLDWVIEYEFSAFMHMEPEVLSGVCMMVSVDEATEAEMNGLYRLVAFTSYMNESDASLQNIVRKVNEMQAQVAQRYTKLVFTDFIKQYFAHDEGTMKRLVHFFYLFTTQDCDTWLLNIYKSFVEITFKESTDMLVHDEILDDYLIICLAEPLCF